MEVVLSVDIGFERAVVIVVLLMTIVRVYGAWHSSWLVSSTTLASGTCA